MYVQLAEPSLRVSLTLAMASGLKKSGRQSREEITKLSKKAEGSQYIYAQ